VKKYRKDGNHPIDVFYNEIEGDKREDEISKEMHRKLEGASKVLKSVEENPYDFSINTMDIILKAEEIKSRRVSKREVFLFLLISFSILTIYFSFAYLYSIQILFYTQLLMVFIGPWLLVPLSILRERGMK